MGYRYGNGFCLLPVQLLKIFRIYISQVLLQPILIWNQPLPSVFSLIFLGKIYNSQQHIAGWCQNSPVGSFPIAGSKNVAGEIFLRTVCLCSRFPHLDLGGKVYSPYRVGIQNLADCLRIAQCESPMDMDAVKLAPQGYNYGQGYIT